MKVYYWILFILFSGCSIPKKEKPADGPSPPLFKEIPASYSALDFNNAIVENEEVNYFIYTYLYNGGGVGIGDINNDNLPDIYMTSTQGNDKLFLNKGSLKFEDISQRAGIDKYAGQKTGVTMLDINNDGFLDIYVCRAGMQANAEDRRNLLFINKGDNTFQESAAQYGIDDIGHSTQAAFFDYDKDGDLDLYVLNHPGEFKQWLRDMAAKIAAPVLKTSDHFYRNEGNNTFVDVTQSVGITNYGHGLGISVGDLNQDGWPDVYVTNDFNAHDYYYVNNGDGTFTESLKKYFPHCSYFAMGCDLVDINNDKNLDLFVVEMLPEDNIRQKTNMAPMDMERFDLMVESGLHYQYMRNTLQINNGNGYFSDIAYYAGIDKTDWSWGTLFGDFDNDGDDDLVVANGFLKDTQDKDFSRASNELAKNNNNKLSYEQAAALMKSTPVKNYAYQNNGNYQFEDVSDKWGFNFKGFSNGMAYGDLDRDGDLDIVVNNINANVSLYENTNNSENFIAFILKGPANNTSGLNTQVTLFTESGIQFKNFHVTRGFESCVDQIVHFGLKQNEKITKVEVVWPDGKAQTIASPLKGKYHQLEYSKADGTVPSTAETPKTLFADVTAQTSLAFAHQEQPYNDFAREVLIPHKLSQLGPALAYADVDANGLTDCYVGGAHQQAGVLWLQMKAGQFTKSSSATWATDKDYEDVDALFFDADGDGDKDLYVVSGSNEFDENSNLYQDRLYINNGKGDFNKNNNALPAMTTSGGCVRAADFDKDGDEDLFVGGRLVPGNYPVAAKSYLLENNNGQFKDVTAETSKGLENAGMITDALWTDFNGDGQLDLIVVGEWTDILFYQNNNGNFALANDKTGLGKHVGWWNCIKAADLDGDGDDDYVLGNLGLNYKYHATDEKPFEIYSSDFDNNGQRDIVVGYYSGKELYPVRGLQCSSEQIPDIKKKFTTYEAFGKANIFEIYGDALNDALHYQANDFSSLVLWNEGGGRFKAAALPFQVQWAPAQDILVADVNQDQLPDLIAAGNWFVAEIETPRADNGTGLVMINQGDKTFKTLTVMESGFFANQDGRGLGWLYCGDQQPPLLLVANNNSALQVFQFKGLENQ